MSASRKRSLAEWTALQQQTNIRDLPTEELHICLRKQRYRGWTYLHFAFRLGSYEDIEEVMSRLSTEMRFELLKCGTNGTRSTPLMKLMLNSSLLNSSRIANNLRGLLCLIFRSLSNNQIFQLLNMTNVDKCNIIWYAARDNHFRAAEQLLQLVGPAQKLKLLGVDWRMKSSLEENKLTSPFEKAKKQKQPRRLFEMLEEMKTEALVSVTLEDPNHPDYKRRVSELVQYEPLKLGQIEKLSSQLNTYIIPTNQSKSRRCALIFYNTEDREGADEEAEELELALKLLDFDFHPVEWTSTFDLQRKVQEKMDQIKSECCMLLVSVMSHGMNGSMMGNDGSTLPVNDFLHQFTQFVPEQVPMIMIVQACQGFEKQKIGKKNPPIDMANPGKPDEDRRIVLVRPHTVLLLSTVAGGSAVRGSYTGALARQFRLADGDTDIYDTHCEAVKSMSKIEPPQILEYRCTLLRGKLYLPKSKQVWNDSSGEESGVGESDESRIY